MMKHILLVFLIIHAFFSFSQKGMEGSWQGIMVRDGSTNDQAILVYAQFIIENGVLEGKTRNEVYSTDQFAVKRIKGKAKDNQISFSEYLIEKKKSSSQSTWCNIGCELVYNDSTGYLKGRYTSSDCKRNSGQIILYRSESVFSATEESPQSHAWFKPFITDLKKGYNSPEIRKKERTDFVFQPIYFDYDKAEIRPEFYDFLRKMVRVVDGHTDLRIKVTGHTDGDGSDAYNEELSKKRAEAIVSFFVSCGLRKDRIVVDFKGEKQPVDSNETSEGKQHNRRVDFSFI